MSAKCPHCNDRFPPHERKLLNNLVLCPRCGVVLGVV